MSNETKALALIDHLITYVRNHRKKCGLDPVWCPKEEELLKIYEDIMEILTYSEDNNGTI